MSQPVSYARDAELALVTIDNPPVNATSQAVRAGLLEAIHRAAADDSRALVLCCAGRTFIAGADITEFGKPPLPPSLPEVLDALEALAKPVVVAIHAPRSVAGWRRPWRGITASPIRAQSSDCPR